MSLQNQTKKAIIYARSRHDSKFEENKRLNAQLHTCKEWAAEKGVEIAHIFSDAGESANNLERPWFSYLVKFIRDITVEQIDYLVCTNLDRLCRDATRLTILENILQQAGIEIVIIEPNLGESR